MRVESRQEEKAGNWRRKTAIGDGVAWFSELTKAGRLTATASRTNQVGAGHVPFDAPEV